ncbi:MAG TPA: MMPL family transporter [Gemmataceae bacterium]|nr:MMPL family transporter [Gemmataceae bacterium]
MFDFLGRLTTTHAWKVCAAWALVALLLGLVAPAWDTRAHDDDIHFLPADCDSVRGFRLLEQAFPQDVYASRVIFTFERPDRPLDENDFALADRLVAELRQLQREEPDLQIGSVHSHRDPFIGRRLVSADGQCTLLKVSLGTPYQAVKTRHTVDRIEARLRQRLAEAGPDAPRLLATGPAGAGRDLTRASSEGLHATTVATVALVVIVLLLVYRAPLLALVPLVTIVLSAWVALKVLALMTLVPGVYLVNISKVFAIVLLYGAGTDYCLFLISRYREELVGGASGAAALGRSVRAVGGALTASAATVVCGLGLMGCAEFAKIRCAGPAIGLSLAVVLLASLTLTPALLHLLGPIVFWPRSGPGPVRGTGADLWERISRQVLARPVTIWGAAVLLLLPLAVLGARLRPDHRPIGQLSPSSDSIKGLEVIQRHFTAGETGPVTVLLAADTDWNSPAGRHLVAQLSRGLAGLANVAEVRSLTQPLGQPIASCPPAGPGARSGVLGGLLKLAPGDLAAAVREQAGRKARDFYVAALPADAAGRPRYVTRLDVVFATDPFDARSLATLELIQIYLREELPRTRLVSGVQAECYGFTVEMRDLAAVTERDRQRINGLVLAGVLVILWAVVRRPWLAVYLLVSVLFSYYATLGAVALFGQAFLGTPLNEVEWRVPFFLFTILVAVGEDYNILLMKRVLQERRRCGSEQGMARALARTGSTISACGLIMAGTFATLMLSGLGTLVQIGFALAFGVLLDTFVVRPLLVPAFTVAVWRAAGVSRPVERAAGVSRPVEASRDTTGPLTQPAGPAAGQLGKRPAA